MELWQKQAVFAQNVGKLLEFIFEHDHLCTLGEAWRSSDQAKIYASEGKGIVHSLHCERLAIDLDLFTTSGQYLTDSISYKMFGEYWKTLNPLNRWGGDFPPPRVDGNHFEMHEE